MPRAVSAEGSNLWPRQGKQLKLCCHQEVWEGWLPLVLCPSTSHTHHVHLLPPHSCSARSVFSWSLALLVALRARDWLLRPVKTIDRTICLVPWGFPSSLTHRKPGFKLTLNGLSWKDWEGLVFWSIHNEKRIWAWFVKWLTFQWQICHLDRPFGYVYWCSQHWILNFWMAHCHHCPIT